MTKQFQIQGGPEIIETVCRKILTILSEHQDLKTIRLFGEPGTGKTTLCKSLLSLLNYNKEVSSPSFSLVNEYRTPEHGVIYHFDLYRIKSSEELAEMGFDEYLFSGNICIIEWPEIANNLIDFPTLNISLDYINQSERVYSLQY